MTANSVPIVHVEHLFAGASSQQLFAEHLDDSVSSAESARPPCLVILSATSIAAHEDLDGLKRLIAAF